MLPILHFFPTDPRCHGNETWSKIGHNSAFVRDFSQIFAPIGGLRGWAIECCQSQFPPTDPRCHGNESCDKIGYSSACVKDFRKIFAPIGGLCGWAIECCQSHFPRCHDDEIRDKIGYNAACVRDICEIFCICGRVFGNGLSNAANWILLRQTLVAMATKFETKWAISWLVQQISPRSLHLTEVRVEGLAIRWRQSKSTTVNPDFQV